ncbi:MAG: recombinase A [Planctomycetota bacterium]
MSPTSPTINGLAHAHTATLPSWSLVELAGRLVEIASWRAGAALTFALELVLHAQETRAPAAWITPRERAFLPSDAEACGIDLAALPVVRVADEHAVAAAGDMLARSGAFGLIVLDLESAEVPLGVLSRLAGLARAHATAIVVLTKKPPERASLGSFVSLRADARFERRGDGMFTCELTIPRDRRRAAGWKHVEVRRGPPGLP